MKNNCSVAQVLKYKGDHDGQAAKALFNMSMTADIICFHCHQAIEKYIKAVLIKHGLTAPRTHDLETLVDLIAPIVPLISGLPEDLFLMTQYAVSARYGEMAEPDMQDAEQALYFLDEVLNILQPELRELESQT